MRQSRTGIQAVLRVLGCITAVLGFSQTSHAAPTHKITHPAIARHIIHKPIIHHVVVHHPVIRHEIIHRPAIHHVVYRRRFVRRLNYRHPYPVHRFLHHYVHRAAYLWCVPYARDVSHIDLTGDAFLWWAEAAGRYARGTRPVVGAVLNFRSSPRIPLGHVAVVEKVINSREVLVDQANWVPDTVTREVPVIDVSRNNNWSAVQVSIGDGRFGMTYPTYGFIYDQTPGGMIYANNDGTEVAEAPAPHKIRLIAPNRTLR